MCSAMISRSGNGRASNNRMLPITKATSATSGRTPALAPAAPCAATWRRTTEASSRSWPTRAAAMRAAALSSRSPAPSSAAICSTGRPRCRPSDVSRRMSSGASRTAPRSMSREADRPTDCSSRLSKTECPSAPPWAALRSACRVATVWSRVSWCSSPRRHSQAREFPTCATYTLSPTTAAIVRVVDISGLESCSAASLTRPEAWLKQSRRKPVMARRPSSSSARASLRMRASQWARRSTSLSASEAASGPPIPSATPQSPSAGMQRTASSLPARPEPGSVMAMARLTSMAVLRGRAPSMGDRRRCCERPYSGRSRPVLRPTLGHLQRRSRRPRGLISSA